MQRMNAGIEPPFETPNQWLRRVLQARGVSEGELSRRLGSGRAYISQLLAGTRPVHLPDLANYLNLTPHESAYAELLAGCYEEVGRLHVITEKGSNALSAMAQIEDAFLQTAYRLFRQTSTRSETVALARLRRDLSLAITVTRYLLHLVKADNKSFLNESNVAIHTRHPADNFVGEILTRGQNSTLNSFQDLRQKVLVVLRSSATANKVRNATLGRYYALHMLARYVPGSDVAIVDSAVEGHDVFDRRMALYGLAISRGGADLARLIDEIESNHDFAKVTIIFDAHHYGDVALNDTSQHNIGKLHNSVTQYLLYAETARPSEFYQLELLKLVTVAKVFGSSHFPLDLRSSILRIIDRITDGESRSRIEKTFLEVMEAIYPKER